MRRLPLQPPILGNRLSASAFGIRARFLRGILFEMSFRRLLPLIPLLLLTLPGSAGTPSQAPDQSAPVLSDAEVRRRDAAAWYLKGRLQAQESEFEDAIKDMRKAVELDPDDGSLHAEFADLLRDLSVPAEAEKEARKAAQLSPDDPWAQRILGQILLAGAKDRAGVEEAAVALKKANDLRPGDPSGAMAYAQALLRLDRPAEAVTVLERVLDRGRGPSVPLLYGEALEKSGRFGDAEDVFQSILRIDPDNRAASLGLLRVYERGRQWDKAIPLVQHYLKAQPANLGLKVQYASLLLRARRFSEARKTLDQVLAADPGNREALRLYAGLLSETREVDKADELLRKLAALDPDDPDVPFRRAVNFVEARRLDEAEKILRDLRGRLLKKGTKGPELAEVDGQLAYIAYLRKDYDAASALLKPHLFDEEGLNQQAFNLLVQIARDRERPADGLKVAREAAAKSKSVAVRATLGEFLLRSASDADRAEGEKILTGLAKESREGALASADAWQRLEKYGRAADTARAALETYREDPDLLFRLAASLEREKKMAESVAAFEQLLSVRADHAAGLNYLGYMWAERGENLPRALELIQKAVDLDPGNGAYLDSLGWAYYQLGKLDLARKNLQAAFELSPDDPTIEEHLGDLCEKLGEVEKARAHWKRALTLKPEDGGKKLEEKLRRTGGVADVLGKK
jgi:tetratricopeptide (TPR) repeat protein